MKIIKIDGVKIGTINIILIGKRNWDKDYDLGSVTFTCGKRGYTLDVGMSYTDDIEEPNTEIECHLERDTETFPVDEYKYDLTKDDLNSKDLKVEMFVGGTFENKIESMTLIVEFSDGTIKEIKVEQE